MSNKVIGIEYTLKDAKTGEQLDTNVGQTPLEFISGKGQIIKGLEDKLVNMSANEEADVLVEAKDGYGEYNEEAVQTLPKEQFAGIELSEGMSLYGQGEHGETIQVVVKSFDDTNVTIDYNHPMAGKTLMFSVAILSLRDATEEEVQSGVVGGFAAMGGGCCGGGGCGTGHDHDDHDHGDSHGGGCGTGGGHGGCGCH
ncbi:peptidylprolyl isomerase [Aliarcobacter cryaerophilus ATCC 43158]|uniref:Peptidyl-prolyl cis-trans isomerase n=1 Tax=Aliarcobacter cryaerophilus ATCC 43158 TaxID=1032070 RepID=A0AAD0X9G5_9BACT|nr:peptidylprolyl isomerase [Aliarcobacter cryaerophilus]AYJ80709.1 FKBP-type peptidyl-prolyl cis-trans isomerase [Aliarcobacter cryaerophilus ATCC 43158]PRM99402.1 peptidylprolyl isomerase [Aliarcobacter cryaerophilus]QCZ23039.1 peptidylprolyl isomerase [Aliarcobacter cryaerophilus ATCC 43158]